MFKSLSVHSVIMFLGDIIVFFTALYVALVLRNFDLSLDEFWLHVPAFSIMFVLYQIVLYVAGFYSRQFIPTARRTFDRLVPTHIVAVIVMALIFYAMPVFGISPKTNLLVFAVVLFAGVFLWKCFGSRLFTLNPTRAVMIGSERELNHVLATQPLWNIQIVERLAKTASLVRINDALKAYDTDTVIVGIDRYPRIDVLYKLIFQNVTIVDTIALEEEISERVDTEHIDELWFIRHARNQQNRWQAFAKRFFDLLISIPVMCAYALVFPFVALAIKLEDDGPLFIQMPRIGLGGKTFMLNKFRSMTADQPGKKQRLVNHNKQITRVGAFIRKTAIDELPQVFSVIRGEQSFVGPRPEIPKLVKKYSNEIPHYNMRHLVRPGLTGWAQIKQKTAPHHTADTDMTEEKLSYDLYYIKHNSVFLYIKIVLHTLSIILNRTNH